MDLQLLSRVESHAVDLYKLGKELDDEEENEEVLERVAKLKREKASKTKKKPQGAKDDLSSESPSKAKKPALSRVVEEDVPPQTSSPALGAKKKSKSVPFSLSTLADDNVQDEEEELQQVPPERARSPHVTHAKSTSVLPSPGKKTPKAEKLDAVKAELFQSWISMRSLPVEEQEKIHYEDLFGCFTRNFGKGFALGFGGKVLLNVFTELVSTLRSGKFQFKTFAHSLDGAKDHGLFFALLLASHNSIMYATRDVQHANARYRGAAAGFMSGLVSLAYLPPSMRRSIILFSVVRAFEIACMIGAKRKVLPSLEHGDTALMSLASAFMIYTWLFHPKALDPSYVHFLSRQVQVPTIVVRAMASGQAGLPLENLEALNAARVAMAPKGTVVPLLTDPLMYDAPHLSAAEKAGMILHPGQSFLQFAVKYFINGLRNAAPVYVPVYAVPLLLFSRKRLMKDPLNTLKGAMMGASRSTLFLATYCTFGIGFMSVGRRLGLRYDTIGSFAKIVPFLCGAVAGLATLIEKRSRRIELALYVMSKAVEGLYNALRERLGDRLMAPWGGEQLLFAASFAVVCHANLRHPELVRESYRALLMRFFDTDKRHKFF